MINHYGDAANLVSRLADVRDLPDKGKMTIETTILNLNCIIDAILEHIDTQANGKSCE